MEAVIKKTSQPKMPRAGWFQHRISPELQRRDNICTPQVDPYNRNRRNIGKLFS